MISIDFNKVTYTPDRLIIAQKQEIDPEFKREVEDAFNMSE